MLHVEATTIHSTAVMLHRMGTVAIIILLEIVLHKKIFGISGSHSNAAVILKLTVAVMLGLMPAVMVG